MPFKAIDPELFFKPKSSSDIRWSRYVHPLSQKDLHKCKNKIVLLGYPDDRGTINGGGQKGALEGPQALRSFLYKTTPHSPKSIYDLGNLKIDSDLEKSHERAKSYSRLLFQNKNTVITLGGSHDYAYADGAAFLSSAKFKSPPLIVNFDAHADCRPLDVGLTSGTPFFRLLSEFSNFRFIEIGLQKLCNNKDYLDWAKKKGAHLHFSNDTKAYNNLKKLITSTHDIWVSVDLDVFSSVYSIGTSNNWPLGLSVDQFLLFYKMLLKSKKVRGLGVYELIPRLDAGSITTKLGASLIYEFIESLKS